MKLFFLKVYQSKHYQCVIRNVFIYLKISSYILFLILSSHPLHNDNLRPVFDIQLRFGFEIMCQIFKRNYMGNFIRKLHIRNWKFSVEQKRFKKNHQFT